MNYQLFILFIFIVLKSGAQIVASEQTDFTVDLSPLNGTNCESFFDLVGYTFTNQNESVTFDVISQSMCGPFDYYNISGSHIHLANGGLFTGQSVVFKSLSNNGNITSFDLGDVISPSTISAQWSGFNLHQTPYYGYDVFSFPTGFVGFRLESSPGVFHYGYFSLNVYSSPGYDASLDFGQCFINLTPNESITVGDEPVDCPADLSGDGVVDVNDFIAFNSAFGISCSGCPEDITGDGMVDVNDFLILNSSFGQVCQ